MRSFLFLLLLIPVLSVAQLSTADPALAGVSAERLTRIDQFIEQYINQGRLNGATAIIFRDGKMVYNKAFGYSNVEKKTPIQKDQIFRIASMTKPIVCVGVMMLWEEGKFSLDDPISKFIPEFKNPKVLEKFNPNDTTFTTQPAKREITIRHLLAHTSGLGYPGIGSNFANAIYAKHKVGGGIGTPNLVLKDNMMRLAALPLFNNPGEKFLYGLNTDLLGYLIEVISGMPLDKFLDQKIFSPLGMKDTYFYLPASKYSRLVTLYRQDENAKAVTYPANSNALANFPLVPNGTYFSGGAGLSSTAYDYALFCQMLINGGTLNNTRLLSPHTIQLMTTNQIGESLMFDNPEDIRRFGLGFGLYLDKATMMTPMGYGSYGWDGMFASHFWIDPKNKLVAVFMRNIWPTPDWDFGDRVKVLVYQSIVQ
ncbi:MAG TPA: serine hydrolase domain-containing protein [Chitinophagaceae bacterium]|nr:serine hydrolase domain-containing protein [Chitinophagaceae bacterium]